MNLPSKFKIKFKQVLFLSTIWALCGVFNSIYVYSIFIDERVIFNDANYSFLLNLLINIIAPFFTGLTAGSFVIFFMKDKFRDKPALLSIFLNSIFYMLFILIANVIGAYVYNSMYYGEYFFDPVVIKKTAYYFTTFAFFRGMAYWFIVVSFSAAFLQIIDKYGQSVFWDFVRGKYNKPREEERIFMFMDIKSSTTIAEKLGHLKFFDFLNEFYKDITDPIIYNDGEIYQYVGDEVVIYWSMKNGIEDAKCIKCFFDCKETIESLSDKYLKKFGFKPVFKAGVNYGPVTTGEIGIIKKDIVFSGDVLNTAARIQKECNKYETDFLASGNLIELLNLDTKYSVIEKGDILLRGKAEKTTLFSISYNSLSG